MSKIMAVNAGSSSLKFQLILMPEEKVITSGQVERIGYEDAIFTIKYNGKKDEVTLPVKDHGVAVKILLFALTTILLLLYPSFKLTLNSKFSPALTTLELLKGTIL